MTREEECYLVLFHAKGICPAHYDQDKHRMICDLSCGCPFKNTAACTTNMPQAISYRYCMSKQKLLNDYDNSEARAILLAEALNDDI